MAFNRLADRRIDARNPRTAQRELPAGTLGAGAVGALVVVASAAFVVAAFQLNALCGWLSFPVLGVLLVYSYVKRFSWSAHLVLGLALALAPLGAWLAVRGSIEGGVAPVLALTLAVLTWVAGFDLIYACQDAAFDAREGLHSIPARFGVARALAVSSALHVVTVAALIAVGALAGLGWIWWASVGLAALLLVWEHRLVSPHDLSRVDAAFFTVNGWIGVGLFVGMLLDLSLLGGPV
jgi:4-hydroxybenzoate polyprenyltransferase